jgi:hypothetical protein
MISFNNNNWQFIIAAILCYVLVVISFLLLRDGTKEFEEGMEHYSFY